MLLFFARYKIAAEIIIALLLLTSLMWGFNRFCESKRDEGREEVFALWNKQKLIDAETYRLRSEANQTLVNNALTQGAKNEATIKTLAASTGVAAVGLRDAVAAFNRAGPTAPTIETLANRNDTLSALFTDCADRYRGMAEKADRHANDARTLNDAWPK
jgi:hypothetical protein